MHASSLNKVFFTHLFWYLTWRSREWLDGVFENQNWLGTAFLLSRLYNGVVPEAEGREYLICVNHLVVQYSLCSLLHSHPPHILTELPILQWISLMTDLLSLLGDIVQCNKLQYKWLLFRVSITPGPSQDVCESLKIKYIEFPWITPWILVIFNPVWAPRVIWGREIIKPIKGSRFTMSNIFARKLIERGS
jgi:hypothetical protein